MRLDDPYDYVKEGWNWEGEEEKASKERTGPPLSHNIQGCGVEEKWVSSWCNPEGKVEGKEGTETLHHPVNTPTRPTHHHESPNRTPNERIPRTKTRQLPQNFKAVHIPFAYQHW